MDIRDAIRKMLVEYTALKKIIKIVYLQEMKEEFADAFATSTELWGNTIQYEIKLNPEAFMKPDIESLFAKTSGAYYYSVKSIVYHEMGHCLQLFMPYEKLGLPLKKYNRFSAENPMELLPECFNLYYSLKNLPVRTEIDEKRYQFSKVIIEDYKEHYL